MKKSLWSREFTLITFSTILSAIGGEAINFPISLLVFDKTGSPFLSAIVLSAGVLPDILLPVLAAPLIDRSRKKYWIVILDLIMVVLYFIMAFYVKKFEFEYFAYIGFVLITAILSVFYRLSFIAWYPDLIPVGLEQEGYAVSSAVYPVILIVMAPVSAYLYSKLEMSSLFFITGSLVLISVFFESRIREKGKQAFAQYNIRTYFKDIEEGFCYLKKEKGILNIYSYMSMTQGASDGISLVTQAFFQTNPILSVTMLGFLKSGEMIGRMFGSFFQIRIAVPVKKRYSFTKFVYAVYNLMDMILLFLPFPLMVLNRFLCGALGNTSATIRSAAVASYLPREMRARINGAFQSIFALGGIAFQLFAGVLAEWMGYRGTAVILSAIVMTFMFLLIFLPKERNRLVYESTRAVEPE